MTSANDLESAIRDSGEGWLIDWFEQSEEALSQLRGMLELVNQVAVQRLGYGALDETVLVRAYNENPVRVRGFFQALSGTRSPDMLLMAWRIIQGMAIKSFEISYERKNSFHARVILEPPYGGDDETYESSRIQDFVLFRHIGIMEISGRPVFDGFYALNLADTASESS